MDRVRCTPPVAECKTIKSYFKDKKVNFREKSGSEIDLFVLKITFDRLTFGILVSYHR